MPWWLKIVAKVVLSRLPFGYGFWQQLSLFRHGAMDEPDYVLRNFREHYAAAGEPGAGEAFTALELGPGDSLASALVIKGLGGGECWLADAGDFARKDMAVYRQIALALAERGVAVPDLDGIDDCDAMLSLCQARYLSDGLAGLRQIPDASVDFIWSQAVLEHVRRHDFADTVAELRRVIRSSGVSSHRIDLRDHLDAGLNNLRFSSGLWEREFFARSGFYTNRVGFAEMVDAFEVAGFEVAVTKQDRWPALPLPRAKMAPEFRHRSEDDLLVSGFNVVLRPR